MTDRVLISPRLVCLSGPDGTGKTTQANLVLERWTSEGKRAVSMWLRFSHFFSLPVLALFRIAGYSRVETHADGTKVVRCDISSRRWMSHLYGACVLADMFLATLFRLKIALALRYHVVCDRYVVDTLVDLSECTGIKTYHRTAIGAMIWKLAPQNAKHLVLLAEPHTLRMRRSDLLRDSMMESKVDSYKSIATDLGLTMIDTEGLSTDSVHRRIICEIGECSVNEGTH